MIFCNITRMYVHRYCFQRRPATPQALRNLGFVSGKSRVTGHTSHVTGHGAALYEGCGASSLQLRLDRLLLHGVCHLVGGTHDDEQQHGHMMEVSGLVAVVVVVVVVAVVVVAFLSETLSFICRWSLR